MCTNKTGLDAWLSSLRPRAAGMALSKLSGDEQGIILGQLLNALEPCLAVYFSSASSELRVLLTPALRQQLKADHEAAAALCHKIRMGCMMGCCKGLREAKEVDCIENGLSAADLAMLGRLGTVLPALDWLSIWQFSGAAGPTACSGWRRGWSRARCRP